MQVFSQNAADILALSGRQVRPNFPILIEQSAGTGRQLAGQHLLLFSLIFSAHFPFVFLP